MKEEDTNFVCGLGEGLEEIAVALVDHIDLRKIDFRIDVHVALPIDASQCLGPGRRRSYLASLAGS